MKRREGREDLPHLEDKLKEEGEDGLAHRVHLTPILGLQLVQEAIRLVDVL